MALTSLSRFPDLQTQVQLIICTFATIPLREFRGEMYLSKRLLSQIGAQARRNEKSTLNPLQEAFFRCTSAATLPTFFTLWKPQRYFPGADRTFETRWRKPARATALTRTKLTTVCSLSRQIVLETLKRDVASIIIAKNNDDVDPKLLKEMRQKVLNLLDNMIE